MIDPDGAAAWRAPIVRVRASTAAERADAAALAARTGLRLDDDDDDDDGDGGDGGDGGDSGSHGGGEDEPGGTARRRPPTDAGRSPWTLLVDGGRRALVRPDGVRLQIDFTAGRAAARRRESGLARQPLARALGVSRLRRRLGRTPSVLDATGGLGRDAWFAASLGCPVTLVERSPVVHALLESALAQAARSPDTADVAARVTLLRADATETLGALSPGRVDVVYLDPMYPPARRRAAVSKGMQFLHALLGPSDAREDARLLAAALAAATAQVTVKRPSGAPPLAGDDAFGGQRSCIASPGTRYDVYLAPLSRESS